MCSSSFSVSKNWSYKVSTKSARNSSKLYNRPLARWHHFHYYYQNPSGFCFFVQIKAFVITKFKYERKNEKDSGRSSKMTPSCKWPIFSLTSASPPLSKKDVYLPRLFPTVFTRSLYIATVWNYKWKTVCSLCGWFFPSKKQTGLG